jgi:hypothetical protein
MEECLYNFKQDLKENVKMTSYIKSKYRIFYMFLFNSIIPIDILKEMNYYQNYINNVLNVLDNKKIIETDFFNKYYSNTEKNIENENTNSTCNVFIYANILDESIIIDNIEDLDDKNKVILFIYSVVFDALYNIILYLNNKKREYQIHVIELSVCPLSIFTYVYYGNSLETSYYKIKFILKNQNLIIQNKNLHEIHHVLKESELLCMHLFINSKISNLFNFYHLNELKCSYADTLNDIFYGIVPVQAIKKKYKKYFTINNKQIANYNYEYKSKGLFQNP